VVTAKSRPAAKSLLNVQSWDVADVHAAIESGVQCTALDHFLAESDLPWNEVSRVLRLPDRTLARRRSAGRLASTESDRLLRLAQLYERAVDLWDGDTQSATAWFRGPCRGLGGRTPLATAETEVGAAQVEQLLGRLEYGVFS